MKAAKGRNDLHFQNCINHPVSCLVNSHFDQRTNMTIIPLLFWCQVRRLSCSKTGVYFWLAISNRLQHVFPIYYLLAGEGRYKWVLKMEGKGTLCLVTLASLSLAFLHKGPCCSHWKGSSILYLPIQYQSVWVYMHNCDLSCLQRSVH